MRDWEDAYSKKGEIQKEIVDIVKESLELLRKRNARKILDVGFGTGRNIIFLAEKGFDVYGIDISKTGKMITEKRAKEKDLNVHLELADMKNIPFDDNFFDAIIAVYVIHHNTLDGIKKTVSGLYRVLKNRGILIATLISTKDPRYGTGREIELNTFINLDDPDESDVPHHFTDEKKVRELFSKFNIIKLKENIGYSQRRKMKAVHWEIIAEKT